MKVGSFVYLVDEHIRVTPKWIGQRMIEAAYRAEEEFDEKNPAPRIVTVESAGSCATVRVTPTWATWAEMRCSAIVAALETEASAIEHETGEKGN